MVLRLFFVFTAMLGLAALLVLASAEGLVTAHRGPAGPSLASPAADDAAVRGPSSFWPGRGQ